MILSDFLLSIRGYTKFTDPEVQTDALLTSYLRLGEERVSDELRCADMVQIDTAVLTTNRVRLPADFREMDFLRLMSTGKPLHYKTRDDYYENEEPSGFYTTSGLFLMVGGTPDIVDGVEVEMHYFGDVPPLTNDGESWLSRRYPRLLTDVTMAVASMGMIEDSRAVTWETDAAARITAMNDSYMKSIARGSKLSRRQPGFG